MAKLNISGYQKIKGLKLGDWVCSITTETDLIYTFLFDYIDDSTEVPTQDLFNLITIYRNYENPNGFKLEVDFHIYRSDGLVEEFNGVKERFIYAHDLITLDKFKNILEPILVLNG
jgi:hypothetical protein